jgi:hypothetical protein
MSVAEFRDLAAVKSARGRTRRAAGGAGEDVAAAHNALCLRTAYAADLFAVPTPTRQIGPTRARGEFTAVRVARATADYVGVMGRLSDAQGRAVYVEAKRCAAATLPLRTIQPHQRAALDRCHAAGGVAVLLVVPAPGGVRTRLVACPWDIVAERIAAEASSLSRAELAAWEVPAGQPYLAMPWLVRGLAEPARGPR